MATTRSARTLTLSALRQPAARGAHAAPARRSRAGLAAAVATLAAVSLVPGSAAAEPGIGEVASRVGALDLQAQQAVEDLAEAKIALTEAERKAAAVQEKVAREQAQLDQVRAQIAGLASASYRRGAQDSLVSLVTESTPTSFLQKAGALDRIARSQADALATVRTARHRLDTAKATAERELAVQKAAADKVAAEKARIEATLREQQQVLAGLKEAERQRVEAARAAAEAAAAAATVTAPAEGAAATAPRATRSRTAAPAPAPTGATYTGPASGRAAIAVNEAHKHVGKSYQWGASGPDRFDCSGLTSYVWAKAGVSLPHSSRMQYSQGRKVARADVQPGDLVFHGNPIHHVGIYIGDGNMISATRTGDFVRIQYAFRSDYTGAVRP